VKSDDRKPMSRAGRLWSRHDRRRSCRSFRQHL